MADNFQSSKVAASELSSSTKFNNFVQAVEDAINDIPVDQLDTVSGNNGKVVTTTAGVAGWAALPATTLTVATTVAGLPGSPVAGQLGALRIGSSPYDLIGLIFDTTINKWVSPSFYLIATVVLATTNSTTYAQPSGGSLVNSSQMSNFKRIYDAGLRPQVKIGAAVSVSAGTPNVRVGLGIDEYTSGDTATVELGTVEGSAFDSGDFVASTSTKFVATDWLSASMNAPTENHVDLSVQARTSSGTLTLSRTSYEWRWVSA